jgi:putative ABC transport system substrate-binding protein
MDRRRFLLTSLAGAFAGKLAAEAQQRRHVAMLYGAPTDATVGQQRAFEESLGVLGHHIGQNLVVTHRGTNALPEDITKAARDLIALKPDVIVAWSTVGAVAIKRTLTTLPVVFLSVGSPVEIGLVSSLARPGGTMTGVAAAESTEVYGKRLQLLKEILPRLSRVAVHTRSVTPTRLLHWRRLVVSRPHLTCWCIPSLLSLRVGSGRHFAG